MSEKPRSQGGWAEEMLRKIIENPPPPPTHCACGWTVAKCDADPRGVAGCDQRQKARWS